MAETEKRGFFGKLIGDKKRWRAYRARLRKLPAGYRTAVKEIEHYLFHFVPADSDSMASMFEDLVDLFEQAVANKTPIREIVGDEPVEFAESFAGNYTVSSFVTVQARKRLTEAIARAEKEVNR
ncbi:DUF1048 domain-containing protein [Actinoplanes palleronii]|uniref:DNA-binding ferritin-like protein (Dps family) n=1 Tax=Actinoplanes palleronii TaxID=113570 RepID=A0ABQ4BIY4_9ACTN|nr:DUF1048 domain-containing protein [Actinoplanes palleronii]GIE70623.1 hypothetical protein Apa02nite_067310 [Actinoplanes palleronii]